MLDSRDNSVLKSLKELRKQEEERVKKERTEAEARAAAERKAKEDAERRAMEDAERAKREEEERARRIQAEKEAREREERLRLEESERRARIEAETQLQQERMRLDAQVKSATKAKGAPVGVIVGIVAAALLISGGIIYKLKADHARQLQQLAAQRAEQERLVQQEQLKMAEQQAKQEQQARQIEALKQQLAAAKNDLDRKAIQKKLDEVVRARSHSSGGSSHAAVSRAREKKQSAPTAIPDLIKKKKQVSNDPLDGLNL